MVVIMTMTPLHIIEHGGDLAAVGIVLSAHTLGMFALSPISGRLTDRFGSIRTILGGTAVLATAALLAAAAPAEGGLVLLLALFLLGWGWNLGFVAGSAMLSHHLELHERTRVQGVADALIWSSSAAASLGSGLIMATVGYTALGILGAGLVIIPVLALRALRRAVDREPEIPGEIDIVAGGAARHRLPRGEIDSGASGGGPGGPCAGPPRGGRPRPHASTSSSGTDSSAAWARRTSPGPNTTQGVSPGPTNRRMSQP
jgi:MFS family permease